MKLENCCAIGISGEISSGKSTLANRLVENHGFDLIPFGVFVKHKAKDLNITPSRENYQNLGEQLICDLGPRVFLRECLEYFSPISTIHVFDGVRHDCMVSELRHTYGTSFIISIEANLHLRYQRYQERNRAEDQQLTLEQFIELSMHPVEKDIQVIAESADLRINGWDEPAVQEASIIRLLNASDCTT